MIRLTIKEIATTLGISVQRAYQKIQQGHFPNHGLCECGKSIMVPVTDLELATPDRRRRKGSDNEV